MVRHPQTEKLQQMMLRPQMKGLRKPMVYRPNRTRIRKRTTTRLDITGLRKPMVYRPNRTRIRKRTTTRLDITGLRKATVHRLQMRGGLSRKEANRLLK